MQRLPRPDPEHHHYTLDDGSRIYPAGTRQGKWLAWLCEGTETRPDGKARAIGSFLNDLNGLRYFDTVNDAAKAIADLRRRRR